MANSAVKFATLGASLINKRSSSVSSVIVGRLTLPSHPSSSSRNCSSQPVYKIDHSGFVNDLGPNPPRNDQLGIRDKIVNRNPRVLEHLNVAGRQNGWKFQAPSRQYTNKLVIDAAGRYVYAYVEHNSGEKVVWASSQEHSLMKRLYSLADISAVKAVAHVLARRCLKAGLHHVSIVESDQVRESSLRLNAFLEVFSSHGIGLEEPEVILPPQRFGVDYDVVDPNQYVDEDAQRVDWPQSNEEYDPEKDLLWDSEGLTRKHPNPKKTWEELGRPLVDPQPKIYPIAGSHLKDVKVELDSNKKIAEITDVKLID